MKKINKTSLKVFNQLVEGLAPGESRKIENAPYMALSVEHLTEDTFSLTHYFESNGDLVADPDMEFYRDSEGDVYPMAIQQVVGGYTKAIILDETGKPSGFKKQAQADLKSFADMWFRNIKVQGFLERL